MGHVNRPLLGQRGGCPAPWTPVGAGRPPRTLLLVGCLLVPESHTLFEKDRVPILFIYFHFHVHHLLTYALCQARPRIPCA